MTTTGAADIIRAVRTLARVCDGASSQDGMGFNGHDASFGRALASLPDEKWTMGRLEAAHKMIGKYRKQLAHHGIDYDAIEIPKEPRREDQAWRIYRDNGRIVFAFPFDYDAKEAVKKMIRGRQFDPKEKLWWAPVTDATIASVGKLVERWPKFQVDESVTAEFEARQRRQEEAIEASQATDAELEIEGLGGELRPFQRAGVLYAVEKQRCFIADEMGVGKTIQALAAIHYLKAWPALVVCPASVKLNWLRESAKWLPDRSIIVMNGPNRIRHGSTSDALWIVNYDLLKKHQKLLERLPLQAIVFDESHYLKSAKTIRSKISRCLADGREIQVQPSGREVLRKVREGVPIRLLLTGTPVVNRAYEAVHQLQVIDRLEDLGGYGHVMGTYGSPYVTESILAEFNQKLRATCYIRRLKKDVAKELPGKQRSHVPIEIDNTLEYKRAETDLVEFVREKALGDKKFEASIAEYSDEEKERLRQHYANDKASKAARAKILVGITTLKQVAARGKISGAIKWVQEFLESGEKLVFFAWHREIVEAVAERFDCRAVTGETPLPKRQEYIDEFGKPDGRALIALNMQAGGTGINGLQESCSNVAFLELGWNDAQHDQAESRLDRIGQSSCVSSWFLLAPGTIDEWIFELIEEKRQQVKATSDGATPTPEEGQESLLDGLIDRFQRAG